VAERLASEIISLPIFPTITDAEIARTAEAVAAFEPK
jgi:dTDP-4-amino-4,6-dideoxygalactose transaminase